MENKKQIKQYMASAISRLEQCIIAIELYEDSEMIQLENIKRYIKDSDSTLTSLKTTLSSILLSYAGDSTGHLASQALEFYHFLMPMVETITQDEDLSKIATGFKYLIVATVAALKDTITVNLANLKPYLEEVQKDEELKEYYDQIQESYKEFLEKYEESDIDDYNEKSSSEVLGKEMLMSVDGIAFINSKSDEIVEIDSDAYNKAMNEGEVYEDENGDIDLSNLTSLPDWITEGE